MQNQDDAAFSFIGFLLLSALSFFAWRSDPLESARPVATGAHREDPQTAGHVTARLWQDPLNVVLERKDKGEKKPVNSLLAAGLYKALSDEEELTVLSVMLSGGPYAEVREERRRRRYAVLSALGDAGFEPRNAEALGIAAFPDIEDANGTPLPDIPYEWFDRDKRHVLVLWLNDASFSGQPFRVFQELIDCFGADFPGTCWNDDRVQSWAPAWNQRRPAWTVLGPATSDTLKAMVADAGSTGTVEILHDIRVFSGLSRFEILSPMTTVTDVELGSSTPAEGNISLLGKQFRQTCQVAKTDETCLRFVRTISTDDRLVEKLVTELGHRGIEPTDDIVVISEWDTHYGRALPNTLSKALKQRAGASVQVNLHPYTYERGIDGLAPGVKPAEAKEPKNRGKGLGNGPIIDDDLVVRRPEGTGQFDYLRRLSTELLSADRRLRIDGGKGVRAVAILGSDVYDKLLILRALRPKLPGAVWVTTDLDANFLHPSEYTWVRNMIIASTYGLRPSKAIKVSTPPFRDNYQTSNYVATLMAIEPKKLNSIFGPAPPDQAAINRAIAPLAYEVGRQDFVMLQDKETDNGDLKLNVDQPPDNPLHVLLGLFLLSSLGLLSVHQLRPHSKRVVALLGVIIAVPLLAALLIFNAGEVTEPLSLTQGVSIWMTELLRVGAFVLGWYWIFKSMRDLIENRDKIQEEYFLGPATDTRSTDEGGQETSAPPQDVVAKTPGEPECLVASRKGRTRCLFTFGVCTGVLVLSVLALRSRIDNVPLVTLLILIGVLWAALVAVLNSFGAKTHSAWRASAILLFLTMLGLMMGTSAMLQGSLIYRLQFLGALWATVIGLWLLFINGWFVCGLRICSINRWVMNDHKECAADLWESYKRYGARRYRFARAMTYTLVYFAFAVILFTLLPAGNTPCRGAWVCAADRLILGLSVLTMLLLLFLVVDAVRLCIYWIQKMQEEDVEWPDEMLALWSKRLSVPRNHVKYWLQIRLIGDRTHAVGRLVYYPVIIILLMLVARSTYFDNWGFPQALAIVVGINLAIAFGAGIQLNRKARLARDAFIERLESERYELEEVRDRPDVPPSASQIETFIDDLKSVHVGAYRKIWEQPIVRSALLIIAGAGIAYTEFMN